MDAQLSLRDKYERAVYELVKQGKLGWSTGPAQHLVRKSKVGRVNRIAKWPVKEASLTPIPAEPRCAALALKSYRRVYDLDPGAKMGRYKKVELLGVKGKVTRGQLNYSLKSWGDVGEWQTLQAALSGLVSKALRRRQIGELENKFDALEMQLARTVAMIALHR